METLDIDIEPVYINGELAVDNGIPYDVKFASVEEGLEQVVEYLQLESRLKVAPHIKILAHLLRPECLSHRASLKQLNFKNTTKIKDRVQDANLILFNTCKRLRLGIYFEIVRIKDHPMSCILKVRILTEG